MVHVRDLSSVSQADMAILEGLFPPDFPEVWAEFTRVFFVGLMASKELAEGTEARARIAIEQAYVMGHQMGGSQPYIPRGAHMETRRNHDLIRREFRGNNYGELASRYDLSVSQVRYLVRSPLTVEDAEYALSHRLAVTRRPDSLRSEGWELPIFLHHGEFSSWPYFFFGGVIKEKLCSELLKMQGESEPDAAEVLSMDVRREEIAAITEEIARLDSNAARLRGEIGRLTRPVLTSAKRLQGEA